MAQLMDQQAQLEPQVQLDPPEKMGQLALPEQMVSLA
jgi:hypothetical protein